MERPGTPEFPAGTPELPVVTPGEIDEESPDDADGAAGRCQLHLSPPGLAAEKRAGSAAVLGLSPQFAFLDKRDAGLVTIDCSEPPSSARRRQASPVPMLDLSSDRRQMNTIPMLDLCADRVQFPMEDSLGSSAARTRDYDGSCSTPLAARTRDDDVGSADLSGHCDLPRRFSSSPSPPTREVPGKPAALRRGSAPATAGTSLAQVKEMFAPDRPRGEVTLCVRLRPGQHDDTCAIVEASNSVRLKPSPSHRSEVREMSDTLFRCDHAFVPDATQEHVYTQAIGPVMDAVIRGYNGAVIAYGQTGSGKTHTMIGSARGKGQGITPRAVSAVFAALGKAAARGASWSIEVSVLEIYNERVRDLLASGIGVTTVDVHEVKTEQQDSACFRCHDATTWPVESPDDALAALTEGVRRRETARTDMNHHSSRSHLIFTLCISQTDHEAGATLRSRLHLVDLAGSERLKRSMQTSTWTSGSPGANDAQTPRSKSSSLGSRAELAKGVTKRLSTPDASSPSCRTPRDQRREAGEINKSLSQLALVIQRLTTPGPVQHVPYRDSVLTRLLAESFGGSSKTCLIVACSSLQENREETRSSLDFGRRAKLVRNKPEINIEVQNEPSAVVKALLMKDLADLVCERDAIHCERDALLKQRSMLEAREQQAQLILNEAAVRSMNQQEEKVVRLRCLEEERDALQGRLHQAQEENLSQTNQFEDDRSALQDKVSRIASELEESHDLRAQNLKRLRNEQAEQRRCWEADVIEKEEQLMGSTSRVGTLMSECSNLKRASKEAEAKIVQLQQDKNVACAKLESQSVAISKRWCEDVSELQREKSATVTRLESEKATLRRQLREAQCSVSQLQEQKASVTRQAFEEKASMSRQLQEDILYIREEKAEIVSALEEAKLEFQRNWQEDVSNVQEAKAVAVAELEKEKGQLLRKLQTALDENRRLQSEQVALEVKVSEEKTVLQAGFEAERASVQRKWKAESSRLMEGKATDISKMENMQVQLHRRMAQEKELLEEEHRRVVTQLELDKSKLHKSWEAAVAESSALQQETADLAACAETDSAQARHQWEKNFLASVSWLQKGRVVGAQSGGEVASAFEIDDEELLSPTVGERVRSLPNSSEIIAHGSMTSPVEHSTGSSVSVVSSVLGSVHGSAASLQEANFFTDNGDLDAYQLGMPLPAESGTIELEHSSQPAPMVRLDADEESSHAMARNSSSKWGSPWSPAWPQGDSTSDGTNGGAGRLAGAVPASFVATRRQAFEGCSR